MNILTPTPSLFRILPNNPRNFASSKYLHRVLPSHCWTCLAILPYIWGFPPTSTVDSYQNHYLTHLTILPRSQHCLNLSALICHLFSHHGWVTCMPHFLHRRCGANASSNMVTRNVLCHHQKSLNFLFWDHCVPQAPLNPKLQDLQGLWMEKKNIPCTLPLLTDIISVPPFSYHG